ncbi:MAG: hypothetical protein ACLFU2_14210, partial [Opitutales bacterium]
MKVFRPGRAWSRHPFLSFLLHSLFLLPTSGLALDRSEAAGVANGILYAARHAPHTDDRSLIESFDLRTGERLETVYFYGRMSVFLVREDALYAGFDEAVKRSTDGGATWEPVLEGLAGVSRIVELGPYLLVDANEADGTWSSPPVRWIIDPATREVVRREFPSGAGRLRADNLHGRLYSRSNFSPRDLRYSDFDPETGAWLGTGGGQPQYHGDFPHGDQIYPFPDGRRVLDNSGILYETERLDYIWEVEPFRRALFLRNYPETPVLLRGSELVTLRRDLTVDRVLATQFYPARLF